MIIFYIFGLISFNFCTAKEKTYNLIRFLETLSVVLPIEMQFHRTIKDLPLIGGQIYAEEDTTTEGNFLVRRDSVTEGVI